MNSENKDAKDPPKHENNIITMPGLLPSYHLLENVIDNEDAGMTDDGSYTLYHVSCDETYATEYMAWVESEEEMWRERHNIAA